MNNMKYSICFISFIFLFMMSMLNFIFMIYFIMNKLVILLEWEIISFNSISIVMSILLDWMSLLFMMFVFLISSVVIYYSKSYMSSELNLMRFIILVLLFVFSMMLLIISPNIISILLGWDGLGLVSYCLVIYYQNLKSYNAGMLTALSNRIGDVLILMVISWMLNYGSWNYIFYLEFMNNDWQMKFVSSMIIMAAMTKSAQIPFSSWLPAAMAAPTPVSALVHSSTLVTAGVYLLIRFNMLLLDTFFLKMLLLLSGLTMFMAGISANYEFDLKKIIALSTLSQLGLMMSILSMGMPDLAFFHLLTHAMFKALLFMCAGVIIHLMNDMQDIRFMGGISMYIPLTTLCMNISNMALCGIPFLAGFYSKDLVLEMVNFSTFNLSIFFLFYLSTGLTMFYSFRLVMYLMINDYNLMSIYNLYDEDYVMLKSMFILLFMSVISGSFLNWMIFPYPYMIYLPFNMKMMVIYVSLIGGMFGYLVSNMNIYSVNKFIMTYNLSNFLGMMWFMPNLSTYGLNYYFLKFSQNLVKNIDLGWSEIYSGFGMMSIMKKNSVLYNIYQMNNFKIYLFSFVIWMVIILFMMLFNI
ncbi:NADH dehydrogenase subunit 5 (mitochondrion) [Helicoverpa armigera]|uniref:NADH-ubiquinone oxidoreductase chain 5 n=4 Tax=Helicoverpa TaxID=7112 RepID=E3T2E2_HELAM|nr:NADH dehydrogenase subunit 5 [Helicoverpa armigera]AZL93583.1 NADH dehydrogenase subunit 5 [Helicoverpa armigera armigera]AZL93635.1 NADH dehydrogenase subunit 5 [Helicoverpa armigera conferta]ACZ83044.1 NADH dehydrogenase subunit 5 [Helicoverpa armigera]AZL93596.1 NADH dehydrogenase subunit 5 [Helicoverpa armigera armigera]AZL93609.1 NADH dehydrogenase subunit 5 [Helicoverpa armigera armigera]